MKVGDLYVHYEIRKITNLLTKCEYKIYACLHGLHAVLTIVARYTIIITNTILKNLSCTSIIIIVTDLLRAAL